MACNITDFIKAHALLELETRKSSSLVPKLSTKPKDNSFCKQESVSNLAVDIDHELSVLSVQIGKGALDNVLFYGISSINLIIEEEHIQLGLKGLRPIPYKLRMAN